MKGYMIFVDGNNAPHVVHATFKIAEKEAKRLARKFPDKEVMLLAVHKRFKMAAGQVESIGSHLPATVVTTAKDLVKHDDPARLMPKQKAETPTMEKSKKLTLPKK